MTLLLENPWPAILTGAIVEVALVVALIATGRGRLLFAMVGVLVVTLAMFLLEWFVATDREQIETQLHAAADGLSENYPSKVLATISDSATELRRFAESTMSAVVFRDVTIDKESLKIVVDDHASPPVAAASSRVVAIGGDRAGNIRGYQHVEEATLRLAKEPSGWRITDYEGHKTRDLRKYIGILK
jgi:hypothetical protein